MDEKVEVVRKNLREWREKKGLSQEDVAVALGVSLLSYSKIERGITELTIKRVFELSSILDVSPVVLLGYGQIYEDYNRISMELEDVTAKKDQLKYDLTNFLNFLRVELPNLSFLGKLLTMIPKANEFFKIIEQTEKEIREKY